MTYFPPPRAADEAHFTNRPRREIVVKHKALEFLARQLVETLFIAAGPERRRNESLCLAASEQGRAMRAGEYPHLNRDGPDDVQSPAVDTCVGGDYLLAHEPLLELIEDLADFARAFGVTLFAVALRKLLVDFLLKRIDGVLPGQFLSDLKGLRKPAGRKVLDVAYDGRIQFNGLDGHLLDTNSGA